LIRFFVAVLFPQRPRVEDQRREPGLPSQSGGVSDAGAGRRVLLSRGVGDAGPFVTSSRHSERLFL